MQSGKVQSNLILKILQEPKLKCLTNTLHKKFQLKKEDAQFKIWIGAALQLAFSVGSQDRYSLRKLMEETVNPLFEPRDRHREDINLLTQCFIVAMVAFHPCGLQSGEKWKNFGNSHDWSRIVNWLESFVQFIVKNHT